MYVLNATHSSMSILADNNNFINIPAGQISEVIICSPNMIKAAMGHGSPKEVGIILDGSWELSIASKITGSTPYLYTSKDEAISKLIDPSVDYSTPLAVEAALEGSRYEIGEKDKRIGELNAEIAELKSRQETFDKTSKELEECRKKLVKAESDFKSVQEIRDKLKSELQESASNLENSESNLAKIRKEVGSLSQENTALNAKLAELENMKLNSDKELLSKDNEIADLKKSLEESIAEIESMKKEFNKACKMFKISKDEEGNWVQA